MGFTNMGNTISIVPEPFNIGNVSWDQNVIVRVLDI